MELVIHIIHAHSCSKVSQLDVVIHINKNVGRLDVSMKHLDFMVAVHERHDDLSEVLLDADCSELPLVDHLLQCSFRAVVSHKVDSVFPLLDLRINNLFELDGIRMV